MSDREGELGVSVGEGEEGERLLLKAADDDGDGGDDGSGGGDRGDGGDL